MLIIKEHTRLATFTISSVCVFCSLTSQLPTPLSLPPSLSLSFALSQTTNKLRRCRPLNVVQYKLACIGAPLQPVGPERGVGGRWWIKDRRTEGARGREACGSLPGRCDGRFNLSIPPCPQQLSETEGLKTPRAEAHKSRLGWSKKAEEEEGLEGGDRGDASSQIWSTRPPASPRQSLVPGAPQGAAASSPTTGSAGWRPYSKCHRLLCFAAACTGEPGREYSWPVPPNS